jgi:hypothetical protein
MSCAPLKKQIKSYPSRNLGIPQLVSLKWFMDRWSEKNPDEVHHPSRKHLTKCLP